MKLVAISLLVAVSMAATGATESDEEERAFLLGDWFHNLFGKKNTTERGLFNWWGGLIPEDEVVEGSTSNNATERKWWGHSRPWHSRPGGRPQRPKPQRPQAKPVLTNGTQVNTTRAWILSNWLDNVFGKHNESAVTRGLFDWFDGLFGDDVETENRRCGGRRPGRRPHHRPSRPSRPSWPSRPSRPSWPSRPSRPSHTRPSQRPQPPQTKPPQAKPPQGVPPKATVAPQVPSPASSAKATAAPQVPTAANPAPATAAPQAKPAAGATAAPQVPVLTVTVPPPQVFPAPQEVFPQPAIPSLGNSTNLNATARAWLLDDLWNTIFPDDDVPADLAPVAATPKAA